MGNPGVQMIPIGIMDDRHFSSCNGNQKLVYHVLEEKTTQTKKKYEIYKRCCLFLCSISHIANEEVIKIDENWQKNPPQAIFIAGKK